MNTIIKIATILLLLTTTIFALSNKELAITIDLSGKQRMLTQKMTKEAFLIKFNINKKKNIEKLTESSKLFDKTLNGLLKGDKELKLVAIKDSKIDEQIKKVLSIWKPFNKEIQNIINRKSIEKSYTTICDKNYKLLEELNQVVELYAFQKREDNFVLANDMNLAGKQRMLLQKMGKSLLLANNGIKVKEHKDEFMESQKLFAKTLKGLQSGDSSLKLRGTELSKINTQLKVVNSLWDREQKTLQNALSGKNVEKAMSALESITKEMESSVKLYTASLDRKQQKDEFTSLIKIHTSLEKMDDKTRELMERLAKSKMEL